MAYTLALNDNWDIYTDENGNIATDDTEYAIAQNVANAIRLFTEDAYFDRQRGIPHFTIELGQKPQAAKTVLTNRIKKAALEVDGVASVEVILEYDKTTRTMGGEIYIALTNGNNFSIEL